MKPKFKIGDKVKCKLHGTVFNINKIALNPNLYYSKDRAERVCSGSKGERLKHYLSVGATNYWDGVPEEDLKMFEEFIDLEL
jgi:hypothetical protein